MALLLVLLPTILACALTRNEQCVWPPATTNTTSTTTPNPCPHSGYQLFAGYNCYKAFPSYGDWKTWSEARQQCIRDGGDLIVMDTEREREDVYIPLYNSVSWESHDFPWVGVYKTGNDWTTVKGEPALSTWWDSGYPKYAARKCAQANSAGELFNNHCALTTPFICEISL